MVDIITPEEFRGGNNTNVSNSIIRPKEFSLDIEDEKEKIILLVFFQPIIKKKNLQ